MPPDRKKDTKTELEDELQEGYAATRPENLELCREFEAADLENWDEY